MRTACKCHGLSGSCALKTCWRKMPHFNQIGERLKSRFDGAVLVTPPNSRPSDVASPALLPAGGHQFKPPDAEDLVYADRSPNYCRRSGRSGSLGTRGRPCDDRSVAVGGCSILCCGRGHRNKVVTVVENCNCKFRWCCEVVCQSCSVNKTVSTCL